MRLLGQSKVKDKADIDGILKLHAEGISNKTIVELYIDKYPTLNMKNVRFLTTHKEYRPQIEKLRAHYLSDPSTVDLFHKKVRLNDLNVQRMQLIDTIDSLKVNNRIPEKKISKYTTLLKRLVEIEIAAA